jgi:Flp pilus assembly protein CpaB
VSRRARALILGLAALACASLAAVVASGYRETVAAQYGPLREVVVARGALPAHTPLGPGDAEHLLAVRRVPARFVPPGALGDPGGAVGLEPSARVPAGSYLVADLLRPPTRTGRRQAGPVAGPGHQPVEITVTGAEALAAGGRDPTGRPVDVVVTTEPGPGGHGRTYVAAPGVRLLALAEGPASDQGADPLARGAQWTATVAVTRAQALRLIHAESFAREVRLIDAAA